MLFCNSNAVVATATEDVVAVTAAAAITLDVVLQL
jgi:hypothetical protein